MPLRVSDDALMKDELRWSSMKTKRVAGYLVEELVKDGPLSTTELLERMNERIKMGTTMNSLGNVLSKCPAFVQTGTVVRAGLVSGHYSVAVWDVDLSALDNAWTSAVAHQYR